MRKTLFVFTLFASSLFVNGQTFNGFALYNSQGSNTTYLIDESQQIAHTWNMTTECNYTVQLKENGNLIRGTKGNTSVFSSGNIAAGGGMVQEIAPDGTIVWEYTYANSDHVSHHDLTLVGDNVLLTAYEKVGIAALSDAGFNNPSSEKWPTHFIELEPDGNGGATIVWEWHIWDHMCQNTDPNANQAILYTQNISDHPELIDINMIQSQGGPPGGGGGDWFHVNGVDYNEDLDQIVFSSRFASEIYIIDHSTTTAEAASHSGGNSGMGGDILYRWGNPSNYGMSGTQIIDNAVHDARWIKDDGRPNGGYLQIFNNSGVSSSVSAIDGIDTPWDAVTNTYLRTPGQAFAPNSYTTRYECAYSSSGQSASDRMSNGNIYVNASGGQGGAGVMYEVDSTGTNIIWGPYNASSQKGFRYECDYPGIIALEPYMYPNGTVTTTCFDVTSVAEKTIVDDLTIFPNPTKGVVTLRFESVEVKNIEIQIINSTGKQVDTHHVNNYIGLVNEKIDFSSFSEGLYFIKITTDKGQSITERIAYIK
jgi:hypothetical protein